MALLTALDLRNRIRERDTTVKAFCTGRCVYHVTRLLEPIAPMGLTGVMMRREFPKDTVTELL